MNQLPIHQLLSRIQQTLAAHDQLILQAPTGAGKSTALPLAMLDWPEISGKILMLEPRRMAARNVARFIAKQCGQTVGKRVGYRVKGESRVSKETQLEVVTEGVLTRMIQQDPELAGIGLIIFDEIHERHLTTDLGLALALELQAGFREDLKIVAMSATLSGLPLRALMPNAVLLESEGRSFPVEIEYQAPGTQQDWLLHMAKVIHDALNQHQMGSLLTFLPGQKEINRLAQYLNERLDTTKYLIAPLYGSLPAAAQDSAIAPAPTGMRKVVLSTNVAESSLTIEGITLVIDSGYKRQASFNPKTGVSRLSLKRISQASAAQRAGRAGRLCAGHCIRLWGQEEHGRLMQADDPEILHGDLTAMVLDAAYWGVSALAELPLLSPANQANEAVAWSLLTQLTLVDDQRKITPHGQAAYQLGCHPRLAHMLLQAQAFDKGDNVGHHLGLAAVLAGILESRTLPRRGADISSYLRDARQGEVAQLARGYLQRVNGANHIDDEVYQSHPDEMALLLALAYPDRIARGRGDHRYLLACGVGVSLREHEALVATPWLVVADFQESQGQSSGLVYLAAKLNPQTLTSELRHCVSNRVECGWDELQGRFVAFEQKRIGAIVVEQRQLQQLDSTLIKQAIYGLLRTKGLSILAFDDKVTQLRQRIALATHYQLAGTWFDVSEQGLLAQLEQWLGPYLDDVRRIGQLKSLDFYGILFNRLPWEQQQQLNEMLPTHWLMKTGTRARIRYEASGRALLSVRLQEALGLAQSPQIAQGKLTVTMELLSPAQRPLALTADLANFWNGAYVEVKKEMKGRYPKHLWPDDPANTLPTKFTKKKTLNNGQ
ncbi:ATP-dependent helicase HrpB [Shewanella colwelliana]|uniref:ATP-dependent helicase HrpB n=1 Tax=Shewanella colwelliana TaxID=23 RepID=A0ABQ4NUP5_SHECO|nr:ATP-dependent helicase HrpB [Shewanella colwelliana]GIU35671.1 ATP-dependent helicase HrpB [Shewanella colwelliana]